MPPGPPLPSDLSLTSSLFNASGSRSPREIGVAFDSGEAGDLAAAECAAWTAARGVLAVGGRIDADESRGQVRGRES